MDLKRRAVFLDRDGVLNDVALVAGRPQPPQSLAELQLLPGVTEACERLRAASGVVLIMVTNQPDVARGTQAKRVVEAMNGWVAAACGLHDVRCCFHDDVDGCGCRKPLPGLLTEAADDWTIDLAGSVMVGDRWRDVTAGQAAGCRTVFLDRQYEEQAPRSPDLVAASLIEALPFIENALRAKELTRV